jgi:hypothetical protein
MFGSAELYTALHDPAILATIDVYDDPAAQVSYPAIFNDLMLPRQEDFPLEKRSINFHRYAPVHLGRDFEQYSYQCNCRAKTFQEAQLIHDTIVSVLNRISLNDYYIVCRTMPCIPPIDERDNYNIPVEILIKLR